MKIASTLRMGSTAMGYPVHRTRMPPRRGADTVSTTFSTLAVLRFRLNVSCKFTGILFESQTPLSVSFH